MQSAIASVIRSFNTEGSGSMIKNPFLTKNLLCVIINRFFSLLDKLYTRKNDKSIPIICNSNAKIRPNKTPEM